ncbi:MAG TPA: hypothetical protein DG048_12640 [Pseudoalteromonas sp.]|nr:hypothetical protein [Pseudoalteromonas sp.]
MSKKLIIAGYNNFNLGDDLMFASIINQTKYDEYFMYGPPIKPYFVEKNIKFIKNGKLEAVRWKFNSDFALVGGSLFMGDNEINLNRFDWKTKLFKRNKLFGGRNFVVGANLGPFNDKEVYLKKLSEVARFVDLWLVRDDFSAKLLSELGVENFKVIPDVVMSLDMSTYKTKKLSKMVSISVTKVEKDGNRLVKQSDFEGEVCTLCNKFIKNGYMVNLLSFEDSNDISVAKVIKNRVNSQDIEIVSYKGDNILEKIAESEFLISTRFHCMIIGALLNKKQIIYEYSEKTSNFAKKYGFEVQKITGDVSGKDFWDTAFEYNEKEIAKMAIKSMEQFDGN